MNRHIARLLRLPGRVWRLFWHQFVPWLSYLASYKRNPMQAVEVWPEGAISLGPRVALFVHFDGTGSVRPHVLDYLSALRQAGLSLAFVTNAARLRPEAARAVRALCDVVIVRRNIGYDFGAMREGIERLGLPRPDTEMVLLLNDSVYGPLQPLGPVLDRLDFELADIWGLTESWQTRYHLQSYFVAFGRKALNSPAWRAFWRQVRPVSAKWWVVLRYEVGLTQRFLRDGLRVAALWRYHDLARHALAQPMPAAPREDEPKDPAREARVAHARHVRASIVHAVPLNPTADFWRELLHAGYPFLKRELLRTNPSFVNNLADWREVAEASGNGNVLAIERDLQRAVRNRAP